MSVADTFELTLALLTVIVGLYWLALTLRLPPSAALLVGSGALAFVPGLPHFVADPDLVLVLFLPPLLMEGAFSDAARAELIRMHHAGLIENEVLHNLERDLDFEQMGLLYQLDD